MTFAELEAEVYIHTKRSDLVALTKTAIRAATLKAHQTDFYSKDIYETGIDLTVSQARHSIDYITLISNLRALKYIRRVDSLTDENTTNFFEIVPPELLVDSYSEFKTDVGYIAGRSLELRGAVDFQYIILGAYVNPIATETGYSSWVALLYPDVIILEAARQIFKSQGKSEEETTYNRLVREQYILLRTNALTDVGY
jgi:hypothetical protein